MIDEHRQQTLASRELVVGWCAWLLASWVLNLLIDGPTWITGPDGRRFVTWDGFVPSARGLIQAMMVGLGLVWPVWRLSQSDRRWPGWRVVSDLVSLLLVAQVVLWPMRMVTSWSVPLVATLDAVMVAWTAAAGLCVWIGLVGGSAVWRTAAAGAGALLVLGGWLVTAATGEAHGATWSPLYQLWVLTGDGGARTIEPALLHAGVVAALVAIGWLVTAATLGQRQLDRV